MPTNHSAFDLLSKVQHQLSLQVDRYLTQEAGVTGAQASALSFLDVNDGCSQKELSVGLGLDTSALTGMVNRLSRKEMVEKHQSLSDKRASTINITPQGQSALSLVHPILQGFNIHLDHEFGEKRMVEFCEVLTFISNSNPKHWKDSSDYTADN